MRSHVNQSTFIQYLFVPASEEDLDLHDLLANREDKEALQNAWNRQSAKTPLLFFHETYHYWQGLRLPFLYRFAILSYRLMMQAYREMAALSQPLRDWDCLLPDLYRLAIPARIYWYDDGSLGSFALGDTEGPPATDATAWWEVTPQGLLETAASVSEFQVTTDKATPLDVITFRRWCKRHPAYLDAYDIASKVLGEELALMAVVPLINGAFETSDPLRGFVEVLSKMNGALRGGQLDSFVGQSEPRRWAEYVDLALSEVHFESNEDDTALFGGPFHRVTLSTWIGATDSNGQQLVHPFLTQKAMDWQRRADVRPAYRWLLSQPAWVEESVLLEALHELDPPLSFLKFRLPSRDVVVSVGDTSLPSMVLKQLLTIYSVVLRASEAGYDPGNRLCHHVQCPLYTANYCSTYPAIPLDFRDCQFPEIHEEISQILGASADGYPK